MMDDILLETVEKINLTDDSHTIYSELVGVRIFLVDVLNDADIKYFDEKICIKIPVMGTVGVPVGGGLYESRMKVMDFSSMDRKKVQEHKKIVISYLKNLIKKIQMCVPSSKPEKKIGF